MTVVIQAVKKFITPQNDTG